MEPLSALSVVTAIVQFLDFSSKIISGTVKIHKSASDGTESGADIRTITNSMISLNETLRNSISEPGLVPFSSQDDEIARLGERCNELGDQLVSALDSLKSQSKNRVWASFRQALKTVWSQNEIDTLRQTIESYRQQISLHILVSLREMATATHENQTQSGFKTQKSLYQTQQTCRKILEEIDKLKRWNQPVLDALKQNYKHTSVAPSHTIPPVRMYQAMDSYNVKEVNRKLLQFLQFREIENRYERILPAYGDTFQWIYRSSSSSESAKLAESDQSTPRRWANFADWIHGAEPLYWITGKAGAGKSTLMKFIYDDKRTKQALQSWTNGRPLVMASYFFWNSGAEIQMSYEGLIRTLTYQVLKQLPYLIPIVFPHRVEAGILFGHVLESDPWTWEELLKAFRTLVKEATKANSLMFFIDGMDEFRGKPSELIDSITGLLEYGPNIKICASSRPWTAFEDAFSHRPHLRIEDLTYGDIKHYVTSELTANPGFKVYRQHDPLFSSQLIENVCVKSSGVFLWVFLVTHSLLEGLSDGERLSDLQRRLDALPVELENLFWKILKSLDEFHFERASQLFQYVSTSSEPLTLLDLSFADEDDPEYAIKAPNVLFSSEQTNSRSELMRRRVNACCKGLLEAKPTDGLPNTPVNYLHRTVKDFLGKAETRLELQAGTKDDFNPFLRLCNIYIMRLKSTEISDYDYFWHTLAHAIDYAIRADPSCTGYQINLLKAIERGYTPKGVYGGNEQDLLRASPLDSAKPMTFFEFAVQCQLVDYVETTLRHMDKAEASLRASEGLHIAIEFYHSGWSDKPAISHARPNVSVIYVLLQHDADPNYKARASWGTTWERLLEQPLRRFGTQENGHTVITRFLEHGADPRNEHVNQYAKYWTEENKLLLKKRKKTTWRRWTGQGSKLRWFG